MTENKANPLASAIIEVFMQSKDATAIYQGEDLKIIFANDAMLAFWGKGREIIGKPFGEAIPELSGQPFEGLLKKVWTSGQTYTAQDTAADLPGKSGQLETFYFDFVYRALLGNDGKTQWILHTATEVSDRMRAWQMVAEKESKEQQSKKELLNSQRRIEQLVLSSPVGMTILKGRELLIEFPNEHILNIWARTRAQVTGKPLLEIFPELIGQPFPEMLNSVLRTGIPVQSREIPVTIGNIDGSQRHLYVDFGYQPLFDLDGTVDAVMVTVKDISDVVAARKALEENKLLLQQANEALAASNEEYIATNEELATLNEEVAATNEELSATNEEVYRLTEELSAVNAKLRLENLDLNASARKLFSLFEDAPVAIGLLRGKELIIETANPEILRLWGKDASVIEKPLDVALPELKGQPFLALLDEVYTSGKPYFGTGQKAAIRQQGELVDLYFNFTYKPVKDENGQTHSIMIVANEVTDQVKTTYAIAEAYQQLNTAFEIGNLGAYEISMLSKEVKYNQNFIQDFGLEPGTPINLDQLLEHVAPDYRERLKEDIDKAANEGSTLQGEFQIRWPDGSHHWIKASGKMLYDAEGKPYKLVGMTENITLQKAFDQRKDDFLSIASHELKTPVTTLRANLQLMDRFKSQLAHPMAEKLVETSLRNMDKLNTMIDNLLNINRFNEGQVKLEKAPFQLKTLLEDCCGNVRQEGIHELVVTGEEIMVNADQSRIEQVLANFVNNAVKYAPLSPQIHLSIEKLDNNVKISVSDNGPGIAKEQLPHLFDRYWRADHSGRHYSGLGLGLFICAEIIRRHGGEIGAHSELGAGTTFWFTLPIDTP